MTENEAIEYIKNMAFMCEKHEKCEYGNQCTTKCLKATKMAIKALEEIQTYRDAEEQGLLLKLPCKVGETVWYIDDDDDDNYPLELLVTKIEVEENSYLRYHAREKDNCGKIGFIKDDIGKSVFLTQEEAEQALAEMKGV